MKNIFKILLLTVFIGISSQASVASAQFFDNFSSSTQPVFFQSDFNQFNPVFDSERAYAQSLIQAFLNTNQSNNFRFNNSFQPLNNFSVLNPNVTNGTPGFGFTPVIVRNSYSNFSSNNGNEPDVDTRLARDIEDDSAELRGSIDMNDFRNGIVFFVYGQDENMIEDVEDDYNEYNDVKDDEENDDFEVIRIDRDLDGYGSYNEDVTNLEDDEEYFFVLCVEYEDDDNDETLECGDLENFETGDNNSNNDEPDVVTNSATDIDDDSAELHGEVDMNDFDNGRVFFVWGEDENHIDDVEDEDQFADIDEDDEDLQKQSVETNFDEDDNFELDVFNLDNNTDIYFRICVEYEDEDNDEILECGDVEEFETDN